MELQILQWDREGEGQPCHTAVEGWLHLFPAVSAMKVNYSHLSHWQSLNMAITHCQRAPQRTWQARFFQSGLKTWFTKEGLWGSLAVCVMKKGLDRCIIHFFQQNYLDDKALWMSKGVHIVSRGLLNCLDVDFEPKIHKRKSSLVSEIKCTLQDWSSQAMYWFSIFMLLLHSELVFFRIRWLFPHCMHGLRFWDPQASECLHALSGQITSATPCPEFLQRSLILLNSYWYIIKGT